MRLSKVWKQRYDMYLRKSFHSVQVIKENLEQWIVDWQYKEDDYGRPVFSGKTKKATEDQFNNIPYVIDSEKATSYSEIKPLQGSKHDLSKWISNRPES
eukprot:scaffold11222_cov213-Cylindrotheca_fusiformis.AAC.1